MENYFKDLSRIDVSENIEKKGKFSYLSWAFAVKALREYDPTATWETVRFDGLPYLKSEVGYFVEVNVTIKGITLGQIHPVLDNRNKPIQKPTSFDINTSIQRCLVKAIALHGLGIWIYAGEDLPIDNAPINAQQVGTLKTKALTLAQLRNKSDVEVYKVLKISDVTKLTESQAEEVINKLDSWITKAQEEDKAEKKGA
jgi:hypothetical protein